jgi:hypothetical protein
MEFVEVLRCRQIMNIVDNLDAFNFDMAETLVHRIYARIVDGCLVVSGADGGIDRHRGQAVAKRSSANVPCLLDCGGRGFWHHCLLF